MRRHLKNTIDVYIVKPYMEFFWIKGDSIFCGLITTLNKTKYGENEKNKI
jgi:hypothetical protein